MQLTPQEMELARRLRLQELRWTWSGRWLALGTVALCLFNLGSIGWFIVAVQEIPPSQRHPPWPDSVVYLLWSLVILGAVSLAMLFSAVWQWRRHLQRTRWLQALAGRVPEQAGARTH